MSGSSKSNRKPISPSVMAGQTHVKDPDLPDFSLMRGPEALVKCQACGVEYKQSWVFEGECWPSCDRTAEIANLVRGISEKYSVCITKKDLED